MLEVALAPAPVAQHVVDQRRRRLLEGAPLVGQHAHRPAGTADERRLDEVVAEDEAGQRSLARQFGQPGASREGAGADDRVVAPIVAGVARPAREPARENGTVDIACELLRAGEERAGADDARHALDEAHARPARHRVAEGEDRLGLHQAVGVENEHRVGRGAVARDPLGDVAGFLVRVLRPVAVGGADMSHAGPERLGEGDPLGCEGILAARVGQDVEGEGVRRRRALQRLQHRLGAGEDTGGVLAVDRQQDRHSKGRRRRGDVARSRLQLGEDAERRGADRQRDPEEGEGHQRGHGDLGDREAAGLEPVEDGREEETGRHERRQADGDARHRLAGRATRRDRRIAKGPPEVLLRHREAGAGHDRRLRALRVSQAHTLVRLVGLPSPICFKRVCCAAASLNIGQDRASSRGGVQR